MSIIPKAGLAMLSLAALTGLATPADAAIDIVLRDKGADLELSYSGTFDTTGLGFIPEMGGEALAEFWPTHLWLADTDYTDNYWGDISGPYSISSAYWSLDAKSRTGDAFAFYFGDGDFMLPAGYVSNARLSGSATFAAVNVADLRLSADSFLWTVENGETVAMRVAPVGVPEIGAEGAMSALVLASGALAATAGRRRRQG